jgi:hypothetical protein
MRSSFLVKLGEALRYNVRAGQLRFATLAHEGED